MPHGRAADEHRLEHGERRGPPGAPDRHLDVAQQGGALLRRELEGDRPARRLRREAELLALGEVVDLHDHAVDLVVEVVAVLLPVPAERVDVVERRRRPRISGFTGKPRSPRNSSVSWWLVNAGPPLDLAELVAPEASSRLAVIAGPSGAGCRRRRCAGWRTRGCPAAAARSLSASKLAIGMYTSPRTSSTSGAPLPAAASGATAMVAHVGGDVLADAAVAAGRGLHEPAALVAQGHGQAVDLQLAHEPSPARPPRPRATRSPHALSSASSIALSRLVIGTRWTTGANVADSGAPPTCVVGESASDELGVLAPRAAAARGPARRSRRRGSPGCRARGSARCGRRSGAELGGAGGKLVGRCHACECKQLGAE